MTKRDQQGRYAKRKSPGFKLFMAGASILSVGLLLLAGRAVMAMLGSFRSCESNVGLTVRSCGKASLNLGDVVIVALFILCAFLAVSVCTASWRLTRSRK